MWISASSLAWHRSCKHVLPPLSETMLFHYFRRSPRRPTARIYLASRGSISMKARMEAERKAEELESQLDPEFPSFVKAMLHSHVVRGFWLVSDNTICSSQQFFSSCWRHVLIFLHDMIERVSRAISVTLTCQSKTPLSRWWMRKIKSLIPTTLPTRRG